MENIEEEEEEEEEEESVDEYEIYLGANEIREEELLEFVDDFLCSSEMRLCTTKDKGEMCQIRTPPKKRQLTLVEKLQKIKQCEELFQNCIRRKFLRDVIAHQENAISIIRQKIFKTHKKYVCHQKERSQLQQQEDKKILDELRAIFHSSFQHLPITAIKKIQAQNKQNVLKANERKRREMEIEKKIMNEAKRQKQIEAIKNKRYDEKIKPKLSPAPSIQSEVIESITIEADLVSDVSEETQINAEEEIPVETIFEFEPKDDKLIDIKYVRSENANAIEEEEQMPKFVLPYIPVINPRLKIDTCSRTLIPELTQEFKSLSRIEKERKRYLAEVRAMSKPPYPLDTFFIWTPKIVKFIDYERNKSYRYKINILNGGSRELRCRFYTIKLNKFIPRLIEVEPMDSQRVIPGQSFSATVKFTPQDTKIHIQGDLFFLTYKVAEKNYKYFSIPVECKPLCTSVCLSPDVVSFDPLPIWKAKRSRHENFRVLKVTNRSKMPCQVVISRVESPCKIHHISSSASEESEMDQDTELLNFNTDEGDAKGCMCGSNSTSEAGKYSLAEEDEVRAYGPFIFEKYSFRLSGKSDEAIKIFFRNVDYVGNYTEAFAVDFYEEGCDGNFECVLNKELIVKAVTTGKFLTAIPDILDFGVCVFGSIYQLRFKVCNSASLPHGVGLKFPLHLKPYLKGSENDVYIEAGGEEEFSIKFFPSEQIKTKNLTNYCKDTGVLEFCIYVSALSKKYLDTPPTRINVFAILTDSNALSLRPEDKSNTFHLNESCIMKEGECRCYSEGDFMINLEECTCVESVLADINLTNHSATVQNYGFLDIPQSIKILPNYGFGEIGPFDTKKLTLVYSPEIEDIPNYLIECGKCDNSLIYSISVNTIKNIGAIRGGLEKPLTYKALKNCFELMLEELKDTKRKLPLIEDMVVCLIFIIENPEMLISVSEGSQEEMSEENLEVDEFENMHHNTPLSRSHNSTIIELQDDNLQYLCDDEATEKEVDLKSNKLWVKATIVDNLCDISHQYVKFPSTPCGSYSVMEIELRAIKKIGDYLEECTCGYVKTVSKCKRHLSYVARFKILGNNRQVNIEPICGKINGGEKIKLTLVVQPQLSQDLIMETARDIKYKQIVKQRQDEWLLKQEKDRAAKLAAGKPAPLLQIPEFVVDDSEIIIDSKEVYQVEMLIWKTMQPYDIKAEFCCNIIFESNEFTRHPEKLYILADCKVIRPAFCHNWETQCINFGSTILGTSSRKLLEIQNILEKDIKPTVTPLLPIGSFSIAFPLRVRLAPEHILRIPITFTPLQQGQDTQYVQIKAGKTICSFILTGAGINCDILSNPNFFICRLEAKLGAFADCSFEIINKTAVAASIKLEKLCELKGEIRPLSIVQEVPTGKAVAPKKSAKFSETLTDEEAASIKKYFSLHTGDSFFEVLGLNNNALVIEPLAKKPIKIRFKNPEVVPIPKSGSAKGKGVPQPPRIFYAIKYNIILGNGCFLKDFVILASFMP